MNHLFCLYVFNKKQDSNLILLAFIALSLLFVRIKYTYDIYLLFLVWNLVLAYVPYFLSTQLKSAIPGYLNFYLLFISWIIFLPNSFYLITDFIHLHYITRFQYLFDVLLISSFTIAGFYAGITSLFHIHTLLTLKYSKTKCYFIIFSLCYLSGYGIYLGRILRFNSWDVLRQPQRLFISLFESCLQLEAYLFTLILGSIILFTYSLFFFIINQYKSSYANIN